MNTLSPKKLNLNLQPAALVEATISKGQGNLSNTGALVIRSGAGDSNISLRNTLPVGLLRYTGGTVDITAGSGTDRTKRSSTGGRRSPLGASATA